jgi:hypothetical protein
MGKLNLDLVKQKRKQYQYHSPEYKQTTNLSVKRNNYNSLDLSSTSDKKVLKLIKFYDTLVSCVTLKPYQSLIVRGKEDFKDSRTWKFFVKVLKNTEEKGYDTRTYIEAQFHRAIAQKWNYPGYKGFPSVNHMVGDKAETYYNSYKARQAHLRRLSGEYVTYRKYGVTWIDVINYSFYADLYQICLVFIQEFEKFRRYAVRHKVEYPQFYEIDDLIKREKKLWDSGKRKNKTKYDQAVSRRTAVTLQAFKKSFMYTELKEYIRDVYITQNSKELSWVILAVIPEMHNIVLTSMKEYRDAIKGELLPSFKKEAKTHTANDEIDRLNNCIILLNKHNNLEPLRSVAYNMESLFEEVEGLLDKHVWDFDTIEDEWILYKGLREYLEISKLY